MRDRGPGASGIFKRLLRSSRETFAQVRTDVMADAITACSIPGPMYHYFLTFLLGHSRCIINLLSRHETPQSCAEVSRRKHRLESQIFRCSAYLSTSLGKHNFAEDAARVQVQKGRSSCPPNDILVDPPIPPWLAGLADCLAPP